MTPEMLLEVLQIRDNWDIQQAALPQCTSNSRVTSELRLATIRLISSLFQDRFEKSWRQEDLDMAIEFMAKAVQLTPDNDPGKIASLGDLGTLHSERFERRGSLEDLGRAIELMEQAAFSTSFDHPSRPAMLNNLGVSYRLRCKRLGELADLEKSVHCNEQAVK
ncbi:hypothetical protein FS749_005179 [Ceratobasidium sp. UAMH 11750]|nr:hypothetical protein FS749_005179 [Ceratobasidium sp. UAMH 11750]